MRKPKFAVLVTRSAFKQQPDLSLYPYFATGYGGNLRGGAQHANRTGCGCQGLAEAVHSCYEAGPFGYGLHRDLVVLGVHNLVVQPVCLDEQHKGVRANFRVI